MTEAITVRQARLEDHDDVAAMTENTWPDRDGGDYLADVFPDWIDDDGDGQRTFVAEADGQVVGIVQAVRLSDHEAWFQGMRVHPDYRGRRISATLNERCLEWARSWGAAVARLMVFSWNEGGLGVARATGFEPGTEFRWLHPGPDPTAKPEGVADDPDAAYEFWRTSGARDHLEGLALDSGESWALSELTRETLRTASDETAVLAVRRDGKPADGGGGGTRAMTFRVRDYERDGERTAEYGAAAWADVDALSTLLDAVARDAADIGADDVRVLVPETARHVSDAAHAGVEVADEPDFVLAADLTGMSVTGN
ncbi:MAG: GNAT family N-acetyltransferase [Halobacteriales archaeon]